MPLWFFSIQICFPTPNICRRSGSRKRKGMLDTCRRLGVPLSSVSTPAVPPPPPPPEPTPDWPSIWEEPSDCLQETCGGKMKENKSKWKVKWRDEVTYIKIHYWGLETPYECNVGGNNSHFIFKFFWIATFHKNPLFIKCIYSSMYQCVLCSVKSWKDKKEKKHVQTWLVV